VFLSVDISVPVQLDTLADTVKSITAPTLRVYRVHAYQLLRATDVIVILGTQEVAAR